MLDNMYMSMKEVERTEKKPKRVKNKKEKGRVTVFLSFPLLTFMSFSREKPTETGPASQVKVKLFGSPILCGCTLTIQHKGRGG